MPTRENSTTILISIDTRDKLAQDCPKGKSYDQYIREQLGYEEASD